MDTPAFFTLIRHIEGLLEDTLGERCDPAKLLGPLHEFTLAVFHRGGELEGRTLAEWNALGHSFRDSVRFVVETGRRPKYELRQFQRMFAPLFELANAELAMVRM